MTGATARMGVVVIGLLLALTYLLLRGSAPDAALHERRLRAIDALTLHQAALQRDVLRASHGLLLNYDPLVKTVARLREASEELRAAGATEGTTGSLMASVVARMQEQEALIEEFKSNHALLQNSVAYFGYLNHRLTGVTEPADRPVSIVVGKLMERMFRFLGGSADDAEAAEVAASLDELSAITAPAALREDIAAVQAHGRLILKTLPVVDRGLSRLLAMPISEYAGAMRDHFMEEHRRAETRAWTFRVLLYVMSVALLIYLSHLYVRLRAKARALRERSDFEHLIANISARMIGTPLDQTGEEIRRGLERLARYTHFDRAYVVLHDRSNTDTLGSLIWSRDPSDGSDRWPGAALAIQAGWGAEGHEGSGCVVVPSVQALPDSEQKSALTKYGIRSWLCVPLWHAGNRIGFLAFDAVESEPQYTDDDIPLLRTAGEIFASALGRDQAEQERQALESQLRHSQRIEAIGTLAGGIAHDFNNVLGAILGNAEMALARLRRHSKGWRHVDEVRKAGERARDIVDQILTFSRRAEQRRVPVEMPALLGETVNLLRASLPPTVELRLRLPHEGVVVLGDPSRLQQVIMNLCTNAAQAMENEGTVDVALDLVALDCERRLSHGLLKAGRYARLIVCDTGHGMDAATMERIFEPFFTTKGSSTGTGLGLAMVHGIVTDHSGAVNVRSRLKAGSTFEAYFPQSEARPGDDEHNKVSMPRGHGEVVLIVDDEKPLVALGEEMLAALGYEPAGFNSGADALAAFRADPERFDLVLADEIMPGMTGTQLAAALHAIRPNLPILLMTGYSASVEAARLNSVGVSEVLRKPLLSAGIARAVAQHLPSRDLRAAASKQLVL